MKVRHLFVGAAFCAVTAMGSSAVYSQTKDEKKPETAKPAAATQPPAAKPAEKPATATPPTASKPAGDKAGGGNEAESMMKMMQEMSAPGKEHEALKPLIGSFTCANKFTMARAPPMESSGVVDRKWMIGNRYVQEEIKGNWMGMPFEGFGIVGYDKLQKMYHCYWIDNMSTGNWTMTGTADAAGKVFTFTGENFDPMVGKKTKGRSTMEFVDNNKHVMKMYGPGPDGKEFMNFEMTCTRK